MRSLRILLPGMALFLCACRTTTTSEQSAFVPSGSGEGISAAFDVIYALQLPTDIAALLEKTGTGYHPEFCIPLEWIPLYSDPGQMAMVIGALGVDLSYSKLFGMFSESAQCFQNIEILGDKLNLPQELFRRGTDELEKYVEDPDSLTVLIEDVYRDVDSHFKESGQESMASLSLLGGWLEAMYFGVMIYRENGVLEMGDRILQQKFALNSLSGLLSNYQESLMVRRFIHPLDKIKSEYAKVEIRYAPEGFRIDSEDKLLHATVSEINYEPEVLDEICRLILQVREDFIHLPLI